MTYNFVSVVPKCFSKFLRKLSIPFLNKKMKKTKRLINVKNGKNKKT